MDALQLPQSPSPPRPPLHPEHSAVSHPSSKAPVHEQSHLNGTSRGPGSSPHETEPVEKCAATSSMSAPSFFCPGGESWKRKPGRPSRREGAPPGSLTFLRASNVGVLILLVIVSLHLAKAQEPWKDEGVPAVCSVRSEDDGWTLALDPWTLHLKTRTTTGFTLRPRSSPALSVSSAATSLVGCIHKA